VGQRGEKSRRKEAASQFVLSEKCNAAEVVREGVIERCRGFPPRGNATSLPDNRSKTRGLSVLPAQRDGRSVACA
jgi:hypothetical protein